MADINGELKGLPPIHIPQRKLIVKIVGDAMVLALVLFKYLDTHVAIEYWKWSTGIWMGATVLDKVPQAVVRIKNGK